VRVGIGVDAHPFGGDGQLVLGGVPMGEPGLEGWSDGDVLSHAIIDALLGATGLGDIGEHFPSSTVDERISSLELLRRTRDLIRDWRVINVDSTVILEKRKLAPHRDRMRSNIAEALGLDPADVSVKATTADGLGALGRSEGVGAVATALVEKR
jgi:2-C-methyl-D-erythritol 2,4-cyclodiphosphate synthase